MSNEVALRPVPRGCFGAGVAHWSEPTREARQGLGGGSIEAVPVEGYVTMARGSVHLRALRGEHSAGRGGRGSCLKVIRWQFGGYRCGLWGRWVPRRLLERVLQPSKLKTMKA